MSLWLRSIILRIWTRSRCQNLPPQEVVCVCPSDCLSHRHLRNPPHLLREFGSNTFVPKWITLCLHVSMDGIVATHAHEIRNRENNIMHLSLNSCHQLLSPFRRAFVRSIPPERSSLQSSRSLHLRYPRRSSARAARVLHAL
jgi:hypothetical protein